MNPNIASYGILSAATVQDMHRKFMSGVAEKARKAVPDAAEGREALIEALETLLVECARKDVRINAEELAEVAKGGLETIRERTEQVESALHTGGPIRSNYPSPRFSDKQKQGLAKAAGMRTEHPQVQATFGGDERLYMPLADDSAGPSETQGKIAAHLETQGYRIVDYKQGYATDAAGKQQFKIGKLLKNEPELFKAFYEDASRTFSSLLVVFSRNADDIARMSTGRVWSSCMGSGGLNYSYVPADIEKGSIIAYLVSEKDPDILNPLARILIKPYVRANDNDQADISTPQDRVFVPDARYGIHNVAFSRQVTVFVNDVLNTGLYGQFRLQTGLYEDSMPKSIIRKHGAALKSDRGGLEWWVDGWLHREDGPAIEHANGGREWYFRGQLHRDGGPAIERHDGSTEWYLNGKRHREDGPAVVKTDGSKSWYLQGALQRSEKSDGTKSWYRNNMLHREDGPAVVKADGTREWVRNGQYHREEGPAIEKADGTREWMRNGRYHREGGPAIERPDGSKTWYLKGKLHREDGPAVVKADGTREWVRNGQYHREEGPAIQKADGSKTWYLKGKRLTEEEFNQWRAGQGTKPAVPRTAMPGPVL